MHKRERQNYHILTSKGEIPEARRQENEAAQKAYDKLLGNTSTLAVSSHMQRPLHACSALYMGIPPACPLTNGGGGGGG